MLKLAVILDEGISTGGGFQQSLNATLLTEKLNKSLNIVYITTVKSNVACLASIGINSSFYRYSFLHLLFRFIRLSPLFNKILTKSFSFLPFSPLEHYLLSRNVDLVYFVTPTTLAYDLSILNYIYTVYICGKKNFIDIYIYIQFYDIRLIM